MINNDEGDGESERNKKVIHGKEDGLGKQNKTGIMKNGQNR